MRHKENTFSQKQRKADEVVNSQFRFSFFSKLTERFPAKAGGAAISALIVLHFVSQFIFFQNENAPIEITSPKIENEQVLEIKREPETIKPNVIETPEPAAEPVIVNPERQAAPLPKTVRKKQPHESKAERLRRAERILTGV